MARATGRQTSAGRGCGAGLVVRLAADRCAAASGPDASAPLLGVARDRTPAADLRIGDIEELPYPSSSFDIVTSFNAIQYADDPAAGVRELARVCRSGGQVAIGVWGDPVRCQTEALFARLRSLAPPPPGTPAPLAVSEPGVVEGLLAKAGLALAGGGEAPVTFSYAGHDQAWTAHVSAGPLQKAIDLTGPDVVRQVLHDVLEADRKPDGELRQDNVFRYIFAAKPGPDRAGARRRTRPRSAGDGCWSCWRATASSRPWSTRCSAAAITAAVGRRPGRLPPPSPSMGEAAVPDRARPPR